MKNMIVLGVAGLLLANASAALAGQNYPPKPFDVTYTVTAQHGTSSLRMQNDGKGHLRSETSGSGYSMVSLIDYTTNTQTSLVEQGKMAMRAKIPPEGGYITDEDSAKKAKATAIGTKVIAGHPCHGWKYTTPGGTTEVWTADDVGCSVLSTTVGPGGKTVMEAKSISKTAPSADQFKIPAGYKLTEM